MPLTNIELPVTKITRRDAGCLWFSHLPDAWMKALDGLGDDEQVTLYLNSRPTLWARMKTGTDGRRTAGLKIVRGADIWQSAEEFVLSIRGMTPYQAVSLGRFKAFCKTQRIPIRPLTLIFGPNSAGKSSFLHGLLFAHEAMTNDAAASLDIRRTSLGGDAVDLGGFKQFLFGRGRTDPKTVEWGVEVETSNFTGRLGELLAPVKKVGVSVQVGQFKYKASAALQPSHWNPFFSDKLTTEEECEFSAGVRIVSYELRTDNTVLLRASLKRKGNAIRFGVDELDDENPIIKQTIKAIVQSSTTTEAILPEDAEAIRTALNDLVPTLSLDLEGLLPRGLVKPDSGDPATERPMLFPIGKGTRQEDLAKSLQFFLPRSLDELVRGITGYLLQTFRRMHYLGPLRSYPPRHLAFTQNHDPNWVPGGGYAWEKVRDDVQVRSKVNAWLGSLERMKTPYQLEVPELFTGESIEQVLWTFMERMQEEGLTIEQDYDDKPEPEGVYPVIKDLDRETERFRNLLREADMAIAHDLFLFDVRKKVPVSHRDVGIGVSQVLPVLVSAFGAKNETWAIEQPELHLHPSLQAELGDVFIESAILSGNTFLLETHSEHLILRILRRIRETTEGSLPSGLPPIRPDDLTVLYVEPQDSGAVVRILEVDRDGEFLDPWPDGFFEEGFRERFGIGK